MLPRELPTGRPLTLLGFEFCVFPLLVMIAHAAVELTWKAPGTRLGSAHRPVSSHSPTVPWGLSGHHGFGDSFSLQPSAYSIPSAPPATPGRRSLLLSLVIIKVG